MYEVSHAAVLPSTASKTPAAAHTPGSAPTEHDGSSTISSTRGHGVAMDDSGVHDATATHSHGRKASVDDVDVAASSK